VSATHHVGAEGERVAERFLRRLGYRILARNFRSAAGEIDLIAMDGQEVVFVEVKTRQATNHTQPEDAVGPGKQRRITQIARHWLARHDVGERTCRFDVVAIELGGDEPQVRHIIEAFEPRP
jgi:putative endonuclease